MPEAASLTKLSDISLPEAVPFRGVMLPVLATPTPFSFSRVTVRNNALQLALSSLPRDNRELAGHIVAQIDGWLRAQARRALCEEVERQKQQYGFSYNSVAIKDTRSRWGSCSGKGNLNFSWRLIMAPDEVLNYVVTHETAHLSHLNHSSDFWNLVRERCPGFRKAKSWLQSNGASLMNWKLSVR
jgi:predicted metal-dependent hydrolase